MPNFTRKTKTAEIAILGDSDGGTGIKGQSRSGQGGFFHSDNLEGVFGESNSPVTAAVAGLQLNPAGSGAGVYGEHKGSGAAIAGVNKGTGLGAFFHGEIKEGVVAETKSPTNAAVAVFQNNPTSSGAAIYAEHIAGLTAGFFRGNVIVTGDVSFPGADCSEDFTIKEDVFAEPGTVMALSETGELVPCEEAYEKKVAGVMAGAGSHRPGIIMDKQVNSTARRQPIALVGKVFCRVDASYGSIEVGDLLTSSATQGHAMKAADPARSLGAVIGKAMAPLRNGRGLIPILISLQ